MLVIIMLVFMELLFKSTWDNDSNFNVSGIAVGYDFNPSSPSPII
jgi:hypothetical protein